MPLEPMRHRDFKTGQGYGRKGLMPSSSPREICPGPPGRVPDSPGSEKNAANGGPSTGDSHPQGHFPLSFRLAVFLAPVTALPAMPGAHEKTGTPEGVPVSDSAVVPERPVFPRRIASVGRGFLRRLRRQTRDELLGS